MFGGIFSSEFFRRNFFVGIFSSEFFSSVVGPSSVRRPSVRPSVRPWGIITLGVLLYRHAIILKRSLNLRRLKSACPEVFGSQNGQLGSIADAQDSHGGLRSIRSIARSLDRVDRFDRFDNFSFVQNFWKF